MPSSNDLVSQGQNWQPESARLRNAWTRAAWSHETRALGHSQNSSLQDALTVRVSASASQDFPPGSAVGLGDPTFVPADNEDSQYNPVFSYVAPTEGKWAIAVRGLEEGTVGLCVLVGVAWAEVDIQSPTDTHADIDAGVLKSGEVGYAKILYKPAGTGVNWCCLQLGGGTSTSERWIVGTMNVDINPGETQLMTRIGGYNPGPLTFSVKLLWFHGGEKISSGKQVGARWFEEEDAYVILHAECED